MSLLLHFLNIFFLIFHTALTLFNLLGWIWKKTRLINLITISLTFASWLVLGFWYGWGYCLCTDWHWEVRQELGYSIQTNSYIQFLVQTLTGAELATQLLNWLTAGALVAAFILSALLNGLSLWKQPGRMF